MYRLDFLYLINNNKSHTIPVHQWSFYLSRCAFTWLHSEPRLYWVLCNVVWKAATLLYAYITSIQFTLNTVTVDGDIELYAAFWELNGDNTCSVCIVLLKRTCLMKRWHRRWLQCLKLLFIVFFYYFILRLSCTVLCFSYPFYILLRWRSLSPNCCAFDNKPSWILCECVCKGMRRVVLLT